MARLILPIVILYPADTILCFSYCRNHCWVSLSGWSVANNEAFGLLSTPHSKLVLVFSYKKLIKKRVTHMFALSNSHYFSYLKEPYLEREEKITY